ncbi:Hypothetical protein SMAX5B_003940 [Scophthalmus maximus]|uniref:Uncharacterized protein n=1 Tax=Scophthalmus maximus TaxID=52904 RepID=A0A2U9AVB5_SCOMX|nr:Hypothetical protein SMAX5B_003940 [Scophthalmus maximus]
MNSEPCEVRGRERREHHPPEGFRSGLKLKTYQAFIDFSVASAAPQVESLSELSRIRDDAEVRYPYAITQPAGLDRDREARERGDGGFCRDGEEGDEKDNRRDL